MMAAQPLQLLLLLCSSGLLATAQQSMCTYTESTVESYSFYVQGAYSSSYDCGLFDWSRCYRTRYNSQLQYASHNVYHVVIGCCSGYHSDGGECVPTCSNCPESHSCLAPYFCACPENWSGEGCTEPPQNVTLNATGADKLEISWSPPPELAVTLYIVIFQDETYHVDPSSDLVMDLDSLNTYTAYTCCVAANTASGASRIACVTKTTQETAPGDAPVNVIVQILNSTAIHIQWDPPLTPNGIVILYTIYINSNPPLNVNATSGTRNISLSGFSPNQMVTVTVSASTKVGEGPRSASTSVATHESVPGPVENLTVSASAYMLHLMWNPPTYPNGVITGYTVLVTNLINDTETIQSNVPPSSQQMTITSGIRPFVRYNVSVTASTGDGPGESVEVILYSQEAAPQSPPPNVTSSRTSATTANVEWDDIDWKDLRGWLVDYEIGYGSVMMSVHQQCPANDSTYTETLSVDNEGEYELTGLDPGLQYCVRLAGRTSAGVGPFSHTLIPWYFNSLFTLTLEKANCTEWIAQDPEEIMVDLARDIGRGAGCHVPHLRNFSCKRSNSQSRRFQFDSDSRQPTITD